MMVIQRSTVNVVLGILGMVLGAFLCLVYTGSVQAAESPIALAGIPTSPVIEDFNGGNLDIAISNASTNSVHILSGDGDGTFTPWTTITAGAKPSYITAGYVNTADAFIDLVAVNFDAVPGTVSVLLGNGFGGFSEVLPRLQTGNRPWSVQIAQIEVAITDPSQDPDLVLVNYNAASTVKVFKGVGDGTFNTTPLTSVPVALQPHSVEVTDLNNDSLVDLVVASDNDPNRAPIPAVSVTVLLGNGSGVFPNATFPAVKDYPLSGQPNKVVSLHLDNTDPLLDLAMANGLTGKVDVLLSVPTTKVPIANDGFLQVIPADVLTTNVQTGTLVGTDADGAVELRHCEPRNERNGRNHKCSDGCLYVYAISRKFRAGLFHVHG
jgi:hypothetical protein